MPAITRPRRAAGRTATLALAGLTTMLALAAAPAAAPAASDLQAQERAVLVTGATSGIGLKMTEVLAANGFFVYAGGRKAEDAERWLASNLGY